MTKFKDKIKNFFLKKSVQYAIIVFIILLLFVGGLLKTINSHEGPPETNQDIELKEG